MSKTMENEQGLIQELLEDVREAQLQGHFNHKAHGWLTGFKKKLIDYRPSDSGDEVERRFRDLAVSLKMTPSELEELLRNHYNEPAVPNSRDVDWEELIKIIKSISGTDNRLWVSEAESVIRTFANKTGK